MTTLRRLFRCKVPQSKCSGMSDSDMTYYLKMSAALQPRTTALATTLRNKAIRFMTEFDCGATSLEEAYRMIMASVAEALAIDPMEELVAKTMADDKKQLDVMQPFFQRGRYRGQGLFLDI